MKLFLTASFLFLYSLMLNAQKKNSFNLVIGGGVSYFFNDKTLHRRIDNTGLIGINYIISNKNQTLSFNPGINYQINAYHSQITAWRLIHINQNLIHVNLDVLMKINKRTLLRVGLIFNEVFNSTISVSQTDVSGRAYYSYGNDELEKGYSVSKMQAGFTIGLSFPFKIRGRDQKFNIKFNQLVSSLVNSDYNLSKLLVGEDVKALSVKARPAVLLIGFDFNFRRIKKKKTEEEN